MPFLDFLELCYISSQGLLRVVDLGRFLSFILDLCPGSTIQNVMKSIEPIHGSFSMGYVKATRGYMGADLSRDFGVCESCGGEPRVAKVSLDVTVRYGGNCYKCTVCLVVASGRIAGEAVDANLSQLVGESRDSNKVFTRVFLFILVAPLLNYDRPHALVESTDGLEVVLEGKVEVRHKMLMVSQSITSFTV